jgi:hypothetical protein
MRASQSESVTNDESLEQELFDTLAALAELRFHAAGPFGLVDDDHYWSLCVRERQLRRVLRNKQPATPIVQKGNGTSGPSARRADHQVR